MVLEGAGFCIAQNKAKGKVHFEDSGLIGKDAVELFAESTGTDGGQAKIVPVLQSVVTAKSSSDLRPVLTVELNKVFFVTGYKIGRRKDWIAFPAGTSSSSSSGWRLRNGWWSCTRARRSSLFR